MAETRARWNAARLKVRSSRDDISGTHKQSDRGLQRPAQLSPRLPSRHRIWGKQGPHRVSLSVFHSPRAHRLHAGGPISAHGLCSFVVSTTRLISWFAEIGTARQSGQSPRGRNVFEFSHASDGAAITRGCIASPVPGTSPQMGAITSSVSAQNRSIVPPKRRRHIAVRRRTRRRRR